MKSTGSKKIGSKQNRSNMTTIDFKSFVTLFYADKAAKLQSLVSLFKQKYGVKEDVVYECLLGLIHDNVCGEWKNNFNSMHEDRSFLLKTKRGLKAISQKYFSPEHIPIGFWKWHESVLGAIETDIKLAQRTFGAKKLGKGARKKDIRNSCLKSFMMMIKADNVTEMITDVTALAKFAGALKNDAKDPEGTVRDIYYEKQKKQSKKGK